MADIPARPSYRLGREAVAQLTGLGRFHEFEPGTTVLRQGDRADHVMLIHRGRVKVILTSAMGVELVAAIRGPADLVGEFSSIDEGTRSASVVTLDQVGASLVPSGRFREFLVSNSALALALLRSVIGRLRESDRRRLEFSSYTVPQRIACVLVEMAVEDRSGTPVFRLSQQDLAGMVGASREAVAKALRRFRAAGVLDTDRLKITLRRPDLLGLAADDLSVYLDADRKPPPRLYPG